MAAMAALIEDYALIGDLQTNALISRDGAMDWLCLPRLDADATFAALLGTEANGHWTVRPTGEVLSVERSYLPDTLVLETTFTTSTGVMRLTDFMPIRQGGPVIIRIVEGISGTVDVRSVMAPRFGFGQIKPFFDKSAAGVLAQAGPDILLHVAPADTEALADDGQIVTDFSVKAGDKRALQILWYRPWENVPLPRDPYVTLRTTIEWWRNWAGAAKYRGPHRDEVVRSLITLKALSYVPTGAIAAAATTSLPETLGGERNWDYRYTWLRDASMTLAALIEEGYHPEAYAFRDWVIRAVAGSPQDMQIMYTITGKRWIPEVTLDWLDGYEGSRPVRVGNGAAGQFQLDVYGELSDAAYLGRRYGMVSQGNMQGAAWRLQLAVAGFVEEQWKRPDEGIWEVRGDPQHFTYSKVMAWVAVDRVVRCIDEFGLAGDRAHWAALADEIKADILANAVDPERNCFTQYYGSTAMDASLLMVPLVGFLPPDDPRIINTIHEVARDLGHDGLVLRYRTDETHDGLAGEEGAFLICSFWLVQCLALIGEHDEAQRMFDHLLSLCNDVGLLAEEYDPVLGRMLGNMPQAFSHIGLINAAHALAGSGQSPLG